MRELIKSIALPIAVQCLYISALVIGVQGNLIAFGMFGLWTAAIIISRGIMMLWGNSDMFYPWEFPRAMFTVVGEIVIIGMLIWYNLPLIALLMTVTWIGCQIVRFSRK